MRTLWSLCRSVAGVIGAYFVIVVVMITVVDMALGGVTWRESTGAVLALAAVVSVASAVLGGYVGTRIAGKAPRLHALAMIGIIAFDTTWILVKGLDSDPVWVTITAGATLALGLLIGAELRARQLTRQPLGDAG
ncbi:hypothetical protein ABI59_17910 [Acidobacteria bacterium Mor1]|nr:hypothetical protein ABI59_17910 [Acidobacteria bacterium Mor1]